MLGSTPTGSITWSTSSSTGTFSSVSTPLSSGTASTAYTDTNAGTVTITATYSGDADNAPSSGSATLFLTQTTTVTTALSPDTIDLGSSVADTATVSASTGGGSATGFANFYVLTGGTWINLGSTFLNAGSSTIGYTPQASGTYYLMALYIGDSTIASSSSVAETLTVNPALDAWISNTPGDLEVGQSGQFIAAVTGGSGTYSYQWYVNGAPVSGATSQTFNYAPQTADVGPANINAVVTDSLGISANTGLSYFTVNPAPTVSITPATVNIDAGQPQTFTATITGGDAPFSYLWFLNGHSVPIATGATWTFTPNTSGSDSVYVQVTDAAAVTFDSNVATVNAAAVGDWTMFHSDTGHSGSSSSTGPTTSNLLWSYPTGGAVYSSPAIVNGVVYVGSDDGNVYALNAYTGNQLWEFFAFGAVDSSPTVVDGVVYVGSGDGNVYALNSATGSLIWHSPIGSPIDSSPTVANGLVYVASENCYVYALNAANGAQIWSYQTWGSVSSSPAVANGVVYIGSDDGNVYALDATTGALDWSFSTYAVSGGPVVSSPVVVNGVVYVGSEDGYVYALDALTGNLNWSFSTYSLSGSGGQVTSSPAVANGVVYFGCNDNNVYALDATTGLPIWKCTTNGAVESSPAVANGVVYVGSDDGNVYAFNAANGVLIWSNWFDSAAVRSSPAISNGALYVGSDDGNVYAFGQFLILSTPAINGLQVDFNAAVSSDFGYVQWSFGDGSGASVGSSYSHTYGSDGSYTVTATAFYTDGSSLSASMVVNVWAGELSGGKQLTLNAGSGGSVSYSSNVGSGTIPAGGSTTLYLAAGDSVSLTETPSSGHTFTSWTTSGASNPTPTSQSISLTINQDATATATFAAAPTAHSVMPVTGGSATVDQSTTTGTSVTVSGPSLSDGTKLDVTSVYYGSQQPSGTGAISVSGAVFYDVNVVRDDGAALGSDVYVTVSFTGAGFSSSSVIMYWSSGSWVPVATTFTAPDTVTGTIPASALGGTPCLVGNLNVFSAPEYPIGALAAVAACFVAFAATLKLKKSPPHTNNKRVA